MQKASPNGQLAKSLNMQLRFVNDPAGTTSAPEELVASWGDIEIHVGDENLTAYIDGQNVYRAVSWYALPVLEWLAQNWDALLHEERTPHPINAQLASQAPWILGAHIDNDDLSAENRWYEWWKRHDMSSAREGGMLPQILIRRRRSLVEFSWRPTALAGVPPQVRFLAAPGGLRLPLAESAREMWRFLVESTDALHRKLPESQRLRALKKELDSLLTDPVRRRKRFAWLLGLDLPDSGTEDQYSRLQEQLHAAVADREVAYTLLDVERVPSELPVEGSFLAADLMRTLDPDAAQEDILRIAKLVKVGEPSRRLFKVLGDVDLQVRFDLPDWTNGYNMARQFTEVLPVSNENPVNLGTVLGQLGITQASVELVSRVRGASLMGANLQPTAFVNTSIQPRLDHPMHRFTVAREIYHLLFESDASGRVGIASGSWAPAGIERRANAFAAYLLMPPKAVKMRWVRETSIIESISRVAAEFEVSVSAMAHHLSNLELISETERDSAIESLSTL